MSDYQLRMERGQAAEAAPIAPLDAPLPEPMDQVVEQQQPEYVQEEVAQAAPEPQPVAQGESDREKNLRILRERSERAERERDEAIKIMRDMAERVNQSKPASKEEEADDISLADDSLVEGKHLSAYKKELRKIKEQLSQYQQQSSAATTEVRLKTQYPDFDAVVSRDNVELLKDQYPEIAASLAANPDLYSKASATYTMLKKLGIAEDPVSAADRERVQKNAAKPRPLVSVSPQQGASPLARANAFAEGLTPDLQKQLLKEMEAARRAM